jgi:hypothetical protein
MRVSYHPDFPKDIKGYEGRYQNVSQRLALRFRAEIDDAIERIKESPSSAGHFLNTGSQVVKKFEDATLPHFHFSFFTAYLSICSFFVPSSRAPRTL